MTKMLSLVAFLAAVSALGGCSMISKGKADTADVGGGGGDDDSPALAGTMAEAKTYHVGDEITAPAECHTSGYMKIDAPAGQAFQVDIGISTEGACVDVSYLTTTGGSQNGGQMFGEICEPKTLDVTGLDGGSFLQVSESGACKGTDISIALH
jgi:hypothetical protein